MVTRPYIKKKPRTNYFGFGKKVRKRRKRTYLGRGMTVSVSCPYVNKRNRLMLGEGKRKKEKNSKQKGGFIAPILTALAPTAIDLVKKLIK